MKTFAVILILPALVLSVAAADTGFDRYKVIVDKRPFGEEPIEAEPVQISLNQSFARNLRLSMLFEGPDGDVRVGVIDAKNSKSYILGIGETQDGLELVEADLNASEAMLRKENEVALFKLESGEIEPLSKRQQSERRSSYAERRRARMEAVKKKVSEAEKPRLTGEALREHLKEVQMDAIRTGKPPLPMPLTPEMDAQLVAEGVLPPQ